MRSNVGTEDYPVLMGPEGWFHLRPFLKERMQHVHTYHGGTETFTCVKNVFGALCKEVSTR